MSIKGKKDRHHLLEIISYYDDNGNEIVIYNTKQRLKELGIYNDYNLTIELSVSEHSKLHLKYSPSKRMKLLDTLAIGRNTRKENNYKQSDKQIDWNKSGNAHRGHKWSNETKERNADMAKKRGVKISESLKGKTRGPQSEAHKKARSEAAKLWWQKRKMGLI